MKIFKDFKMCKVVCMITLHISLLFEYFIASSSILINLQEPHAETYITYINCEVYDIFRSFSVSPERIATTIVDFSTEEKGTQYNNHQSILRNSINSGLRCRKCN